MRACFVFKPIIFASAVTGVRRASRKFFLPAVCPTADRVWRRARAMRSVLLPLDRSTARVHHLLLARWLMSAAVTR